MSGSRAAPTTLPGFHDHHVHLLAAAARKASVDVSSAADVREVVRAVGTAAARRAPGEWIRAWGYDDAMLAERRHPALAELDAASDRHPIVLHHRTGHVGVVNSRARSRLEASSGRRIPADGLLVDEHEILDRVPRLPDRTLEAAAAELSADLAKAGVTAVTDATATNAWEDIQRVGALLRDGHVRQRVDMFVSLDALEDLAARGLTAGAIVDGVRLTHVKLVVEPDTTRPELAERVVRCVRAGWPVALHVTGLVEADVALDVLATAPTPAHGTHRIEHLSLCLDDQVERLRGMTVTVVLNPGFITERAAKYAETLGDAERDWLIRARSLLSAGVEVRAASDAPVTDSVPLRAMRAAVERCGGGAALGARERITAREAVAMFMPEPRCGRRDDGVLLTEDPRRSAAALRRAEVVATLIAGRTAYDRRGTE